MKIETDKSERIAFSAVKTKVDRFIALETYKHAWSEVYNFLDKVPGYEPAEQLKEFKEAGKVKLRKYMDEIKTTDTKLNGRCNPDTVLLKVI